MRGETGRIKRKGSRYEEGTEMRGNRSRYEGRRRAGK